MPLNTGTMLGPYKIVSRAGVMSEVYGRGTREPTVPSRSRCSRRN
jgi:hypothetical protein